PLTANALKLLFPPDWRAVMPPKKGHGCRDLMVPGPGTDTVLMSRFQTIFLVPFPMYDSVSTVLLGKRCWISKKYWIAYCEGRNGSATGIAMFCGTVVTPAKRPEPAAPGDRWGK